MRTLSALAAIIFLLQGLLLAWWLPQKWKTCQRLYDSRPAQIICLLDS